MMNRITIISEISKTRKSTVSLAAVDGYDFPVIVKILKNVNVDVYLQVMKLNDEFYPHIYECYEEADQLIVIEEYIEGITLEEFGETHTFSIEETKEVFLQICNAVQCLHKCEPPIIHRDIKPSNILLTKAEKIKLIDFDASREYRDQGQTEDTRILGTMEYAPPEQFGYSQTDTRSDIYAMGVVLYELTYGKRFTRTESHDLASLNAKHLQYIIDKCTMFDPNNRYQSVNEIIKDLNKIKCGKENYLWLRRILIGVGFAATFACITILIYHYQSQKKASIHVEVNDDFSVETPEDEVEQETKAEEDSEISSPSQMTQSVSKDQIPLESIKEDISFAEQSDNQKGDIIEDNAELTVEPTVEPTIQDSMIPTIEPTIEPILEATATPTTKPTVTPTQEVVATPTVEVTVTPTITPSTSGLSNNEKNEQSMDEAIVDASVEKKLYEDHMISHYYKNASIKKELLLYSAGMEGKKVAYITCTLLGAESKIVLSSKDFSMDHSIIAIHTNFLDGLSNVYYQMDVYFTDETSSRTIFRVHNEKEDYVDAELSLVNSNYNFSLSNQDTLHCILRNEKGRKLSKIQIDGKDVAKELYTLLNNGRAIEMKKELFEQYNRDTLEITMVMDNGTTSMLMVKVQDKEKQIPYMNQGRFSVDLSSPTDLDIPIIFNDYTKVLFIHALNGNDRILEEYWLQNDNGVVIKKEYFQQLSSGVYEWVIEFGDIGLLFHVTVYGG